MNITNGDTDLEVDCATFSLIIQNFLHVTDKYLIEHFCNPFFLSHCSSIISLATRCAMPSFRMHLRARGKVAQVFKILSDAPQHPVSEILFILSHLREIAAFCCLFCPRWRCYKVAFRSLGSRCFVFFFYSSFNHQ